jgi:hypothetical protein
LQIIEECKLQRLMRRCAFMLCLSIGLVDVGRVATAAPDDPLLPFVGRDAGTIGDLHLPGVERQASSGGMPIALTLLRDGDDVTLSLGGISFVFADDGSRFLLLERSEAPEIAFEAGFLRLVDGGAVVQYSRVDRDGARRHFRLLLFRMNDGAMIATLLTASGRDGLSVWGTGELHRLTPLPQSDRPSTPP